MQCKQLLELLNEFRSTFAKNLGKLGCTNVTQMEITEQENSPPIVCRPYKVSPSERLEISTIVDEWKKYGIISETNSPYASPVLLVGKKDGTKRLCIDYRRLSQQIKADPYPMADIDNQLSALSDGELFTTLDLANGYLQIPLNEKNKDKTAFITTDTTARFNRMPFGIRNGPAEFKKVMDQVFHKLIQSGTVHCYLDDVILSCKNWEHMMEVLRQVLTALQRANLTLKPSKCVFMAEELNYQGFRIAKGQLKPGDKVEAINKYPVPSNVHEVRRFLGLSGFFRRFIPKYAVIAEPLTKLTKKDMEFQ